VIEQPMPQGTGREIAPLVIEDIEARMKKGEETYGERLRAFNGRDATLDAYEEALDFAIYMRQRMEENAKIKLWIHIESKRILYTAEAAGLLHPREFTHFVNGLKNLLDGEPA